MYAAQYSVRLMGPNTQYNLDMRSKVTSLVKGRRQIHGPLDSNFGKVVVSARAHASCYSTGYLGLLGRAQALSTAALTALLLWPTQQRSEMW